MRPYQWLFEQRLAEAQTSARLKAPRTLLNAQRAQAACASVLGDERVAAIRKVLTQMGLERSSIQVMFHEKFLQACAVHLYSEDVVDLTTVMATHGWQHVKQSVLTLTPRRFGKTTSVAMFVAAYALCVSKSESCVFSTGKRASGKMLELIASLVNTVPGGASRIMKQNQVRLPRAICLLLSVLTVSRRSNCGCAATRRMTCARSQAILAQYRRYVASVATSLF